MKDLGDERDLADFVAPPQKGRARPSRGWLTAHGVAWGLLLIVLVGVVRKFEAIFRDFGVDLPGMTMVVIKAAHLGIHLVPLSLILMGADWAVLNALDRRGEAGRYRAWSIAMLVVPILLFTTTVVALTMPFLNVLNRLSG